MHELLGRRDFLGAAALAGAAGIAPAWATPRAPGWPNVARLLASYVDARKLPGMLAALGFATGAPQYLARGAESFADADPVGPDSLFRLYSMTKPVTAMAAMILIDEGRLGLDQPLAEILPKFARMQVQVTPDGSLDDLRPARTAITIRHLLTHTAGLGYSIIQRGPLKTAMEQAGVISGLVSRIPIPGLDRGRAVASLATFADRLAGLPLVYEPGTRWSYSLALDLIGRVIEVVSGSGFDAFLAERIFGPAGMTSTWFQVPAAEARRLTTNYAILGGVPLPLDPAGSSVFLDPPPFPMGGSGLVGSPRDYDRFLTMLLGYGRIGGRRVMSERAVRLATSNLLPPGVDTRGSLIAGFGFGAGGRVGQGTYGWSGAAGTMGFVDYGRRLRAAVYAQYMLAQAYPLLAEFLRAVAADLAAGAAA